MPLAVAGAGHCGRSDGSRRTVGQRRYDQSGDNTTAVAAALQRTGDVITSLAVLLIIVVGAFSASGIAFIKLMASA